MALRGWLESHTTIMSICRSVNADYGDRDFQIRSHQKPFVDRASPTPTREAHSALANSLARAGGGDPRGRAGTESEGERQGMTGGKGPWFHIGTFPPLPAFKMLQPLQLQENIVYI